MKIILGTANYNTNYGLLKNNMKKKDLVQILSLCKKNGINKNGDWTDAILDRADKESTMAAMNRRIIILVILALIIFTQIAPVFFDVPTVIPTITEGFSFFGIQFTPDVVEYIEIQAGSVLKMDEIFGWATMIIEFYFGAQLAKGK